MTRFLRISPAFMTAACFAASVSAQADKVIKNNDGSCQISVPSDWTAGAVPGTATSADKKVSVTVSSPKMIDSFDELKQTARTVYKNSKVTSETATAFEMAGKSITGKPDVYRAVPVAAGKFCIAEVIYESGTADSATKIVETLKGAGR